MKHQHPYPSIMKGMVCYKLLYNGLMNILQKIFKEHYEEIVYILRPRKSIIENVNKMINCGDPSFGGALYGCTECGKLKFVLFRCKSRFCPSCGTMYSIDRTTAMSCRSCGFDLFLDNMFKTVSFLGINSLRRFLSVFSDFHISADCSAVTVKLPCQL